MSLILCGFHNKHLYSPTCLIIIEDECPLLLGRQREDRKWLTTRVQKKITRSVLTFLIRPVWPIKPKQYTSYGLLPCWTNENREILNNRAKEGQQYWSYWSLETLVDAKTSLNYCSWILMNDGSYMFVECMSRVSFVKSSSILQRETMIEIWWILIWERH